MSKPVLALDFDDLIYPFMDTLVPFHNATYGTALDLNDFHTFEFSEIWGGTLEESIAKIDECFDSLEGHPEPIDGSANAVKQLADMFELIIVTARPDSLRETTESFINQHFPDTFSSVHLCNSYAPEGYVNKKTKADVCQASDAVGLVDDSLSNVAAVAATGRFGVLFGNYGWNKADVLPAGVVRANDWNDVVRRLEHLYPRNSDSRRTN